MRIGLTPRQALVRLAVSLAGSAVNLPIAVLRGGPIVSGTIVTVRGIDYVVP